MTKTVGTNAYIGKKNRLITEFNGELNGNIFEQGSPAKDGRVNKRIFGDIM